MTFQFESMSDFFNMGGYGFFVWASFLITFLCMAGILIQSLFVSVKIKEGVQKEKARAERIMAARAARKLKQKAKASELANKATGGDMVDNLDSTQDTQTAHSSNIKEVPDEPKT